MTVEVHENETGQVVEHTQDAARDSVPEASAPDISYNRIARVALPMVLSTAAGIGAQLANTALIGHMGGNALYVRSVYAPVAFLFLAVTTGCSVTVQVAAARAAGGAERERIGAVLGSAIRLGVLVFALVGGLLILLSGPLADAVQVSPALRGSFHGFLAEMTLAGLLGLIGEQCSAVLRGLGRTGIAAVITGSYVALVIAIIVVYGLLQHGGLGAVPVACAVAGAAEIAIGLCVLIRTGVVEPRRLLAWRPEVARMLLRIGLPVALSSAILAIVNLLLLRVAAPAGDDAVAGFIAGYTVQTAVIVPAVGLGSAVAILMNQSLGGGRAADARTLFRRGLLIAVGGYAVTSIAMFLLAGIIARLMSGDPAIAAQTQRFVEIVGPTFGFTGVMLCTMTVLEQVGHGPIAVGLNVVYFTAIVTIGWLAVGTGHDLSGLYWTMAICGVTGLVAGLPVSARAALRPRALAHDPTPEAEADS